MRGNKLGLGASVALMAALLLLGRQALARQAYTINDALRQAIRTNPSVGEASANKRATQAELGQAQSTLLPQVRIEASVGPEAFDQSAAVDPITALPIPVAGAGAWRDGSQESVVVRQTLFDGFASIHDIWRQTARVNAAAFRVQERTGLIALDAAEAYIDVVRYLRLVALAERNVATHQNIFSNVNSRFQGGRAGEGDLEQARERVENAEAQLAQFRQSLDNARAAYRKVVGLAPFNLRFPAPLRGMPPSKDQALATTIRSNPTIRAAASDAEAAREAFRATDGAFMPKFYLEGRATHYDNTYPFLGVTHDDYSGKVVMSWDIFRGGQDSWKRSEEAERFTQASLAHARLLREAYESIDKAWAARTVTATRIAALLRQLDADRKTITAFQKEYELGQRSLIDLLNAQNQYFNAAVSLTSARGVAVFADYQLLAAMGTLVEYLKAPPPVDAAPIDIGPLGTVAYSWPTFRFKLPKVGSEPLHVGVPAPSVRQTQVNASPQLQAPTSEAFGDRWPHAPFALTMAGIKEWFAERSGQNQTMPPAANVADLTALDQDSLSYAESGKPFWMLTASPKNGNH